MSYRNIIKENIKNNKDYYSLYNMDNVERCKIDSDYLGEVMLANDYLIWQTIYKYCGNPEFLASANGIEKDDIHQLARLGFVKAIQRFDTSRGIKFSSYAETAIKNEVNDYIRGQLGVVRLSRNANILLREIKKLETANIKEIAEELNKSEDLISKILAASKPLTSIWDSCNVSHDNTEEYPLIDTLCDEDNPSMEDIIVNKLDSIDSMESVIDNILEYLSPLESDVLKLRVSGSSQNDIAKKLNLTNLQVVKTNKRIVRIAKKFLRHIL